MEDLKDFEQYMAHLSEGLGHSDRHAGLRGYTTGLMSPLQRKSVEPMAAHMDPLQRVRATSRCITSWPTRTGRTSACCWGYASGSCR